MPTFETGNSVPSTDPRDFKDNREAFDNAMNSTGTWTDRFGVSHDSVQKTISDIADVAAADISDRFNEAISQSASIVSTGAWQPSTSYSVNETWSYDSIVYLVITAYTSDASDATVDVSGGSVVPFADRSKFLNGRFDTMSLAIDFVTNYPDLFSDGSFIQVVYNGSLTTWAIASGETPNGYDTMDAGTKQLVREDSAQMATTDPVESMAEGSALTISCVGDSITWGSNGDNTGVQVTNPYPVLLEDILQEYYLNASISVLNKGVSGDDTSDVLGRIANINADAPDVVLLMIGTNDARTDRGISTQQYKRNLQSIIDEVAPAKVILIAPPPSAGNGGVTNPRAVAAYMKAMKEVADKNGLQFVDSYSLLKGIFRSGAYSRGDVQRDRLHFDQFGYQLLAESIFTAGLCNEDLVTKSGQFIDNAYPAIVYSDVTLVANTTLHQAHQRINNSGEAIWYAFVEETDLVGMVFTNSNLTTGTAALSVTAENLSLTGTSMTLTVEQNTAGTTTFSSNVPYFLTKMRPGLNRIKLTCGASNTLPVYGFMATKETQEPYPLSALMNTSTHAYPFSESYAGYNQSAFIPCRMYATTLSDTDDVAIVAELPHKTDGDTHVRIRGHFSRDVYLTFGQQSGTGNDYLPAYSIGFRSAQVAIYHYNIVGTKTIIATNGTIGTTTTGSHRVIDLVCSGNQTLFYIDGTLVFTMPAALPAGFIALSDEDSAGNYSSIDFVGTIDSSVTAGAAIPGERWIDVANDGLVWVDPAGTEKSVTMT